MPVSAITVPVTGTTHHVPAHRVSGRREKHHNHYIHDNQLLLHSKMLKILYIPGTAVLKSYGMLTHMRMRHKCHCSR